MKSQGAKPKAASARQARRRERHPGAILEAARRQFGDQGYQRTTMRGVATAAGVDPRLVAHYFGSKAGLFQASVILPVDTDELLERLFAGPVEASRSAPRPSSSGCSRIPRPGAVS